MDLHPNQIGWALGLASLFLPNRMMAEQHKLNHIHKTVSIFMDTTEMHPVTLEVLPDGLHIKSSLTFRSKDGSRVLNCTLPSFIPIKQIQKADVRDAEEWYRGGGRIAFLRVTTIDQHSKTQTYIFASDSAVRLSSYDAYMTNGRMEWKEGRDGGQSVRLVEKELNDAIALHSTNPLMLSGTDRGSPKAIDAGESVARPFLDKVQTVDFADLIQHKHQVYSVEG